MYIKKVALVCLLIAGLLVTPITFSKDNSQFHTWKNIKLGIGFKTTNEFRNILNGNGIRMDSWADDVLGSSSFKVSPKKTKVQLVKVTVAELGFKNGATRKDIYERAIRLGLQLCPAEVGPQLRLQYKNQPKKEWLPIAMESIRDSGGGLVVFDVVHDGGGLWLRGSNGGPDVFWDGDDHWVFTHRK